MKTQGGQNYIRSGMGTYVGAVRRRVHIATVLLRPPSDHRPGKRQARHAHILQIGLRLAITQTDVRPVMPVSIRYGAGQQLFEMNG